MAWQARLVGAEGNRSSVPTSLSQAKHRAAATPRLEAHIVKTRAKEAKRKEKGAQWAPYGGEEIEALLSEDGGGFYVKWVVPYGSEETSWGSSDWFRPGPTLVPPKDSTWGSGF